MPKRKADTKFKAILFDLGKVILDFNFEPAFKRLSKATGLQPVEIEWHFMNSGLEVLYDGGKISSRQFYTGVKKLLKHPLGYNEFKKVWNEIFTPIPEAVRLINRLHSRYRLVLISNTNAMHYAYLKSKYPLLGKFHRHILSFREKVRKPDRRIYRKAVKACQAHPYEIFYIDDRKDLTDAAGNLGMRTFTFDRKRPQELVKKMEALRIL